MKTLLYTGHTFIHLHIHIDTLNNSYIYCFGENSLAKFGHAMDLTYFGINLTYIYIMYKYNQSVGKQFYLSKL